MLEIKRKQLEIEYVDYVHTQIRANADAHTHDCDVALRDGWTENDLDYIDRLYSENVYNLLCNVKWRGCTQRHVNEVVNHAWKIGFFDVVEKFHNYA